MKKWAKIIIPTSLVVALAVVGAGSAFAHGNFGRWSSLTTAQRLELQTQRQQIEDAITANDYNAWHDLMVASGHGQKILTIISADNFSQFVQAHQLMQQAHDILKGLGLPDRGGRHGGKDDPDEGMDQQDDSESAPSTNQ